MQWLGCITDAKDINSGKLREMVGTERPAMLQSVGSQRGRHDWAAKQHQQEQLFTPADCSIGASASASVLPMDIQDCFPLRWTGWISLLYKGLSRVFSNTTV